MIKLSDEEIMHLAMLSRIQLKPEEISGIKKDVEEVLTYAARVQEFAAHVATTEPASETNIIRDDLVAPTDPEPILRNVPKREDNYVVVPVILENNP